MHIGIEQLAIECLSNSLSFEALQSIQNLLSLMSYRKTTLFSEIIVLFPVQSFPQEVPNCFRNSWHHLHTSLESYCFVETTMQMSECGRVKKTGNKSVPSDIPLQLATIKIVNKIRNFIHHFAVGIVIRSSAFERRKETQFISVLN